MVLEPFVDLSLDDTLRFLATKAPDVSMVEVGAGGYAPNPHCDVDELLASAQARRNWLAVLARYDIDLDALNAWGNPVHPDSDLARLHDRALRQAIRLATALGADRVVAMAGCPGGDPADHTPHFGAGGWLPYLEGIHDRQWADVVAPYWSDLAAFARARTPPCWSASSFTQVPPCTTSRPSRTSVGLGPSLSANFDPSHFFWMGMDGHLVAERICDRVGHVHGKDTLVQRAEPRAQRGARSPLAHFPRVDAVELLGPWPWTRPVMVDRPREATRRIPGDGRLDRARGPIRAGIGRCARSSPLPS